VNTAVRRRDTILASPATQLSATPSPDTPLQAPVLPVTPAPDPSMKHEDAQPPPSSFSPTRSESVAQKVLSGGGSFSSSFGSGLPKSEQLAAAVGGGAGGSGNPIYVSLAERKLPCYSYVLALNLHVSFSQRNMGIPVNQIRRIHVRCCIQ